MPIKAAILFFASHSRERAIVSLLFSPERCIIRRQTFVLSLLVVIAGRSTFSTNRVLTGRFVFTCAFLHI